MRAWTSKPFALPAFSVFCSNELVRLLIVGEAEGLAIPLESLLRESHGDVAQQDCFREWRGEVEQQVDGAVASCCPTPSQVAIRNERLERWLAGESSRATRIVQMRLAGARYIEIARDLGIHQRTVRRIMQRLVKQLDAN